MRFTTPDVPFVSFDAGYQTPLGIHLPPGGRFVGFVRATPVSGDSRPQTYATFTTLAEALAQCRAGAGDVVVVLPGHTENVTDATMLDNLVAGTRIIGCGSGSMKPTFTWTATGSQWTVDQNDVLITGCRLHLDGVNGTVKSIIVTGADCAIENNDIRVASATDLHCLIAIEVSTGAHRFRIANNKVYGIVGEPITDAIHVAAAANDGYIGYNNIQCASTTGTTASLIRVSAAALGLTIEENDLYNTVAASDNCIVLTDVASKGICKNNTITVLTNDAPATNGISIGASSLFGFFNNLVTTNVSVSGALSPAADA